MRVPQVPRVPRVRQVACGQKVCMRNITPLVTLLLVMFWPRTTDACTCLRSACGSLSSADTVFIGTVLRIEPASDSGVGAGRRRIHLGDTRSLIGKAETVVTTATAGVAATHFAKARDISFMRHAGAGLTARWACRCAV